ncbi:MAG: ATP-binding protein [Gemmatimonadaceae bacterium]|nr:ATP-binding protein [Gemmatimonadaceae bacterium]
MPNSQAGELAAHDWRGLAEHLPLLVWHLDATGRVTFATSRTRAFFGDARDAVDHVRLRALLHPADRRSVVHRLSAAVAARARYHGRARVRAASGEYRWLETWAEPRWTGDGGYAGHLGASVDVTGQVTIDEAVRHSAGELAQTTAALRRANAEKDEMLALLGHELRNPIAPLRYAVQSLQLAPAPATLLPTVLPMIGRQVTHLVRMVDAVLDASRLARGTLSLACERLDVSAVLREVVDDHAAAEPARHFRLTLDAANGPLPMVHADRARLAQLFGELLRNAITHTASGATIEVEARAEAGGVGLAVIDAGAGIDPALLARLAEPFAQGAQDFARSRGGLGLGLTIARGLASLHGGTLAITSDGPGRGTCVRIWVPAMGVDMAPDGDGRAAMPRPPRATAPRRILVVEDEPDVARSLEVLLVLLGHTVVLAPTGDDALAAMARASFDVVFCDLGLPGTLDGFAVAAAVTRGDVARPACLVALSGYAGAAVVARARASGFDRHVAKPASLETLLEIVGRVGVP